MSRPRPYGLRVAAGIAGPSRERMNCGGIEFTRASQSDARHLASVVAGAARMQSGSWVWVGACGVILDLTNELAPVLAGEMAEC